MAQRVSDISLENLDLDWGNDGSGVPFSGQAVLNFIKNLFNLINDKFELGEIYSNKSDAEENSSRIEGKTVWIKDTETNKLYEYLWMYNSSGNFTLLPKYSSMPTYLNGNAYYYWINDSNVTNITLNRFKTFNKTITLSDYNPGYLYLKIPSDYEIKSISLKIGDSPLTTPVSIPTPTNNIYKFEIENASTLHLITITLKERQHNGN